MIADGIMRCEASIIVAGGVENGGLRGLHSAFSRAGGGVLKPACRGGAPGPVQRQAGAAARAGGALGSEVLSNFAQRLGPFSRWGAGLAPPPAAGPALLLWLPGAARGGANEAPAAQ